MIQTLIQIAADGLLVVIAFGAVVAILKAVPLKRGLREYPFVIMAGLTSLLVGKLLSLLYQPTVARPFLEMGVDPGAMYIDNPGFPSDHALLATVLVLAVYALTPYKKFAYFLGILLILMSVARVLALVHTPLDVIGGVAAGLGGGLWYLARRSTTSR